MQRVDRWPQREELQQVPQRRAADSSGDVEEADRRLARASREVQRQLRHIDLDHRRVTPADQRSQPRQVLREDGLGEFIDRNRRSTSSERAPSSQEEVQRRSPRLLGVEHGEAAIGIELDSCSPDALVQRPQTR
jgi:hypothetical protein